VPTGIARIIQALGDPRYGSQETDASRSIKEFFETMREVGAVARLMLIRAGAGRCVVPESECKADLHEVLNVPTNRRCGYGELALHASKLSVPRKEKLQLKPRAAWRHIGKDAGLYDLEDICTGKTSIEWMPHGLRVD
jgi:isoquinoline 1-oxidoreductase beta subunit